MNTAFADAAGGAPGAAAPPAAKPLGSTLVTLLRREFWEYRALWLGPAVAAALLALAAISAHVNFDLSHEHDDKMSMLLTPAGRLGLSSFVQWVLSIPLYLVMLFVLSYYLLDCLHAERKDRSILFWKSLPVSDGLTVGSKLLVACVVVPLGVFLLATLAYFVFSLIIAVRVAIGTAPDLLVFDALSWLQVEIVMLAELLLGVLWYAPVAACLLLLSAAVRRPFLWATLPPVFAIVLERIAFGTHHFWSFLHYRTVGIWAVLIRDLNINPETMRSQTLSSAMMHELHFGAAFTDAGLWAGVAVAAALVYVTIRIRRYRDET
ncbi:MAG TPA: hypothetical protein VFO23_11440 [Steroidobacteraceae bacterium]|nr:hypothetical protein [Steroidobacteraceae bacterium]